MAARLSWARSGAQGLRNPSIQRRSASAGYQKYGESFINERRHVADHARGSGEMWRKITYYIATPTIIAVALNTYNLEMAHHQHMEKLIEENGGERPERIVYDYMNVRNKPYFPWGPQSLFFNPETNIPVEED